MICPKCGHSFAIPSDPEGYILWAAPLLEAFEREMREAGWDGEYCGFSFNTSFMEDWSMWYHERPDTVDDKATEKDYETGHAARDDFYLRSGIDPLLMCLCYETLDHGLGLPGDRDNTKLGPMFGPNHCYAGPWRWMNTDT